MVDRYHCLQLLVEMGVLQTVSPGWPQTVILPISASQVARIIGCEPPMPGYDLTFDVWKI
jgi:hypothetical protein